MVTGKIFFKFFIALLLLQSCKSVHPIIQPAHKNSITNWVDTNKILSNAFVGIYAEDRSTGCILMDYNSSKNFTPASTNKILTWLAAQKYLPDTLPGLYYHEMTDTLFIMGGGNPTFLYRNDSIIYKFLKNHPAKLIVYSEQNFTGKNLGKGWAWDDLSYSFNAEKSAFPMHENLLTISDSLIVPPFFEKNIKDSMTTQLVRSWNENQFFIHKKLSKPQKIPFITSPEITVQILAQSLNRNIVFRKSFPNMEWKTFNAYSRDSLLKIMLLESDNFLAEQFLLMISGKIDSTNHELNTEKAIKYIAQNQWQDATPAPKWVDGSGLSRYNLLTPKFLVHLLKRVASNINSDQKLFNFLPQAGKTGTLKTISFYPETVYAKTGTLSNNHSLCGFLTSKSGKKVVFSIMINHYLEKTTAIQQQIGQILYQLYND